jgi:hypothetical protein
MENQQNLDKPKNTEEAERIIEECVEKLRGLSEDGNIPSAWKNFFLKNADDPLKKRGRKRDNERNKAIARQYLAELLKNQSGYYTDNECELRDNSRALPITEDVDKYGAPGEEDPTWGMQARLAEQDWINKNGKKRKVSESTVHRIVKELNAEPKYFQDVASDLIGREIIDELFSKPNAKALGED